MAEEFPEGWTGDITYQLEKDGAPFNATGMSIALSMTNLATGVAVTLTGSVAWLDAATSKAVFSPGANDMKAGRYGIRWVVTAAGKITKHPRSVTPIIWIIATP